MPDMNENSETQQEYFGKTTGKDYREKAIKHYFSIAKERCLFNDESLQNAFYEGFLDCAEFLLPFIEKMKCCEMCKHKNLNWGFSPICEARDNIKIENPLTCKCDKWEIKENG